MKTVKNLSLVILMSATFVGCATAYKNEGDARGRQAYVIECGEETGACFSKAKELCPQGYVTDEISAVGATSLLLFPAQLRTVNISCK